MVTTLHGVENVDMNEWKTVERKFLTNAIQKNKYIRAYYPYRYYLGSDSHEFIEMIVVSSL